ncbi:ABC transporter substrate-binding protein [Thioclava sp. FR2]|uniref:ABC transporter substrate-binding protein n=1 Tax=Thioclava sp. FR2 TaxID=3445780 RepID=UPI003EBC5A42
MVRLLVLATVAAFAGFPADRARAEVAIPIVYLRAEVERPPVLSNLDPIPEDLGIAGAEIALKDNSTTGQFLGHLYSLSFVTVPPDGDLSSAALTALGDAQLILIDAPADSVLAIADMPEAQGALLFNVVSGEARLRSEACRANLLHTIPEDAARTDALMQTLLAKQWTRLVMITGPSESDRAFAQTLNRSAQKFGIEIVAEKEWTFDTDLRESTGQEIPRFMQDFPDHDVVLVADPTDDFGRYIEHNTWLPRPVAGTEGLHPEAWAPVIEAWGAVQLQNRFEDHAHRNMRGQDYAAWAAIRAIGEAVTRTNSADPAALRAYMLGPEFTLDGFKGRALSFRSWNGQLRQPIAVVNDRALVAMPPLPAFLHQRNDMDSLGLDQPESACTEFDE